MKKIFMNTFFTILFFIIWIFYNKNIANIGLFLATFCVFFGNVLIYISGFGVLEMIKITLITFTSFCIFLSIKYPCVQDFTNKILTWLIRLNIGCLFFATENRLLQLFLLLTAITTPIITSSNSSLKLDGVFIDKDLWVILCTIVLAWFYNTYYWFVNSNSYTFTLLAIIIPMIIHFVNQKYFEARALMLCMLLVMHPFNNDKSIFKIKMEI